MRCGDIGGMAACPIRNDGCWYKLLQNDWTGLLTLVSYYLAS